MKLMSIDEFLITQYTEASRPSKRTLIRWIRKGKIAGRKQGKYYYVDIEKVEICTGNLLVDRVLLG